MKKKDEEKCPKTKLIIEFDPSLTCSITRLVVKKKRNKTTRFFNGKMLMFAKVLFITSRKHFSFQMPKQKRFTAIAWLEEFFHIYIYIICKPESYAPDWAFTDVLFEVIIKNDVLHKFDTPHKSWEKCGVRNGIWKKSLVTFLLKIERSLTAPV